MVQQSESESRKLLSGLQAVMAEPVEGQERLNRITRLIGRIHGLGGMLDLPAARRRHARALCDRGACARGGPRHPDADRRGSCRPRRPHVAARQHGQRPGRARFPLHARDGRGTVFLLPRRADHAAGRAARRSRGPVQGRARVLRRRDLRPRGRRHGPCRDDGASAPSTGEGAALRERHTSQEMFPRQLCTGRHRHGPCVAS